jgi:hypothetical protein
MEDWEIVSIEAELDKLRDEREEKENADSNIAATGATGENSGCGKMLLMLIIGLLLFRFVAEFFSLFFNR